MEEVAVLCADGLLPLPLDNRRRHIHWTQCRTGNPKDVQPWQLTREEFWRRMDRCYKEVYQSADSETGSILQFGLVCKELHKDADREEELSTEPFGIPFAPSSEAHMRTLADLHAWQNEPSVHPQRTRRPRCLSFYIVAEGCHSMWHDQVRWAAHGIASRHPHGIPHADIARVC